MSEQPRLDDTTIDFWVELVRAELAKAIANGSHYRIRHELQEDGAWELYFRVEPGLEMSSKGSKEERPVEK